MWFSGSFDSLIHPAGLDLWQLLIALDCVGMWLFADFPFQLMIVSWTVTFIIVITSVLLYECTWMVFNKVFCCFSFVYLFIIYSPLMSSTYMCAIPACDATGFAKGMRSGCSVVGKEQDYQSRGTRIHLVFLWSFGWDFKLRSCLCKTFVLLHKILVHYSLKSDWLLVCFPEQKRSSHSLKTVGAVGIETHCFLGITAERRSPSLSFHCLSFPGKRYLLCPPTKGEVGGGGGGDIGFSSDPVSTGIGVGMTGLYPRYLLNHLMEIHQICLDISMGQAEEQIRFWWPWPHF